jgi:hypothetical protein
MLVWLVLGPHWDGVSESCQGTFYIVWHGPGNLPVLVVPIHVDSQVLFSFPILFYFIVFLENLDEVHGMLFSNVLDAKIIHD